MALQSEVYESWIFTFSIFKKAVYLHHFISIQNNISPTNEILFGGVFIPKLLSTLIGYCFFNKSIFVTITLSTLS